jgi:hypothetical protein
MVDGWMDGWMDGWIVQQEEVQLLLQVIDKQSW